MADRRRFLQVLALAATQVGCPFWAKPARGPLDAGLGKDVPVGSLRVLDGPVALGRDEKGLYALSTICAHRGCDIREHGSIAPTGIHCTCHGSDYDRNGHVTHGPADRDLEHYRVEVRGDGHVIVHGGELVAPDARTALSG